MWGVNSLYLSDYDNCIVHIITKRMKTKEIRNNKIASKYIFELHIIAKLFKKYDRNDFTTKKYLSVITAISVTNIMNPKTFKNIWEIKEIDIMIMGFPKSLELQNEKLKRKLIIVIRKTKKKPKKIIIKNWLQSCKFYDILTLTLKIWGLQFTAYRQ